MNIPGLIQRGFGQMTLIKPQILHLGLESNCPFKHLLIEVPILIQKKFHSISMSIRGLLDPAFHVAGGGKRKKGIRIDMSLRPRFV